jgi:Sigma-70 region 2
LSGDRLGSVVPVMAVNLWRDWQRVHNGDPHRADQKEAAMRRDAGDLNERFTVFVREHGERHLRVAVLLTGDWYAAEDLVQASLVKLYRAWPRPAYPGLSFPARFYGLPLPPIGNCD